MTQHLHAISGRHAVQSAQITISVIPDSSVAARYADVEVAKKLGSRLSHRFPHVGPIKSFAIQVGSGGQPAPVGESIEGYQLFAPSSTDLSLQGIPSTRSLQLTSSHVQLTEFSYERWADFLKLAEEALPPALDALCTNNAPLANVSLQYVDAFLWKSYKEEADASVVFREGTSFLPSHIFSLGHNYWHVYQGYFQDQMPWGGSVLENINVARAPNKRLSCDWFTITTNHRAMPPREIRGAKDILDFYMECIEVLHQRNKEVLRTMLSEEAKRIISLDGAKS